MCISPNVRAQRLDLAYLALALDLKYNIGSMPMLKTNIIQLLDARNIPYRLTSSQTKENHLWHYPKKLTI